MSTLTVSSPQTPTLSEFPEYDILCAIGRASHMGLARAPAIGSLGWYMNMRDSGLTDEEIDEIEKGTYTTTSPSDSESEHIAVTIAPPPPLQRVTKHISIADAVDGEDSSIRDLISEFNSTSWFCATSPSTSEDSYTESSEVRFGSATQVEINLRQALNDALDEWNSELTAWQPSRLFTNKANEIRNVKVARCRHLISAATSLLTDTFGCHTCRDRRTYQGACVNCLDAAKNKPAEPKEHIIHFPLSKLKNQ
jgi:hypothetical protein